MYTNDVKERHECVIGRERVNNAIFADESHRVSETTKQKAKDDAEGYTGIGNRRATNAKRTIF